MTKTGEIRPGYKQTEVGVVPEDWEVGALERVTDSSRSIRYGIVQPGKFCANGRLMLRSQDYSKGWAGPDDMHRVSPALALQYRNAQLEPGDLVMTIVGAGIGQVVVVPSWLSSGVLSRSTGRIAVDAKKADFTYVKEILCGPLGKRQIADCQKEGAQPVVSCRDLAKFSIPIPPPSEQRRIAAALSDTDAMIAALEGMIVKKSDLKQAAMQHLLTGKIRLPGFAGEWEMKRLGEIGEISGAGVDKKIVEGEQSIRLLNYTDAYKRTFVKDSDLEHWVTAPAHKVRRCSIQKGDVFFTPSSETRDDIAHCAVASEDISDAAYSYHVTRLRITENWDARFPAYAFQTRDFLDQAQTVCDGSGTRYVISLSKFRGLTVRFPERSEQTAIAEVLSDMDADLAALEAQATKARAVKQGMVQELLTGRVRLV